MADTRSATSPFCELIRSKKWYFLQAPPATEEDLLDASGHCWCEETGQALGPDSELVNAQDCRAGRGLVSSTARDVRARVDLAPSRTLGLAGRRARAPSGARRATRA